LHNCRRSLTAVSGLCIFFLFPAQPVPAAGEKNTTKSDTQAKTAVTSPEMPTVSMPLMPAMPSMPSLDEPFYTPQKTTDSVYKNNAAASGVPDVQTASTQAAGNTQSVSAAATASAAAADGSSSGVTASDLSALSNLGVLGNLQNLINSPASRQAVSANTVLQQTDTTALLNKILSELQTIKQTQSENLKAQNDASAAYNLKTSGGTPSVLRFTISGTDIIPSCRAIYFSGYEQNGSFLLTGDRKYPSDGKTAAETFYFLFSAAGSDGSKTLYTVTPALSQNPVNKNSPMYLLTHKSGLRASKTGNLITMHINDDSLKTDLLLDIGNKTTSQEK
jgi:hypothetical protein